MAITTLFLTGIEISARMYRGIISDLFTEGIRNAPGGDYLVGPRTAGANMTVQVAAGVAYVQGDDVDRQGIYRVENDALIIDVPIAAAPASGTRTDLVCLRVQDKQALGGTANAASIIVLPGQTALSGTDKTVIALARVSVAAGQTSVQAANITDIRPQSGKATIDFAVKKATGSYTGNGAAARNIAVGFAPDLVIVTNSSGGFAWLHSTNANVIQSARFNGSSTQPSGGSNLSAVGFYLDGGGAINIDTYPYFWSAFKFV